MSQLNMTPVYVSDMIGEAAVKVDAALFGTEVKNDAGAVIGTFPHVYYMHGHPLEIVNILQEKLKLDDEKLERFPLIMLFHDFEIVRNSNVMYGDANLNMAIAALTQPNLTTPERYEQTFRPYLMPIYVELLKQIGASTYFVNALAQINHTRIDRVYWGRTGLYGNVGNQFNDFLDCIEIKGAKLTVKNQHCKPFKQ